MIVGLGNPGPEYTMTRHNAGFMVLDRLADARAKGAVPKSKFNAAIVEFRLNTKLGEEQVLLVKPTTFMNRSGAAVREVVNFYKVTSSKDLLVVVDDLYLPCGSIRLKPAGGTAGHNGLADIQRVLGHDQYPRLRIGIDQKPPVMSQSDYVLGRFTQEQWAAVDPSLTRAAQACEAFVTQGLDATMNQFNVGKD